MKKVLLFLCTILLACGLTGLFYVYKVRFTSNVILKEDYQAKSVGYEKEIQALRDEIVDKEQKLKRLDFEASTIILAFMPQSIEDMKSIDDLSKGYSFSPIIVVDHSLTDDIITGILETASEKGYEVVLTGPIEDESSLLKIENLKAQLSAYGFSDNISFLLRADYDTDENRSALQSFSGLILYTDTGMTGLTAEGLPYFDYSIWRTNSIVNTKVYDCIVGQWKIVFVVDFESIHDEKVSEKTLLKGFDYLEKKVKEGATSYVSVEDAMYIVAESFKTYEQRKAEFEEFKASKMKEIKELEDKVQAIFTE